MALAIGILIAVVVGVLTSLLAQARGWKVAAVLGAMFIACAAYLDATTNLGLDVIAPSLVVGAATKLALDRALEQKARA